MNVHRVAGQRSATIGRARKRELAQRVKRLAVAKVVASDRELIAEFIERSGVTRYAPSAMLPVATKQWMLTAGSSE